jgi:2-oxo-3-hexenedioate decarboxylase
MIDVMSLADEIGQAYATGRTIAVPPSSREGGFDLDSAYAVEQELSRRRQAEGHRAVGVKVGFANKAVWRLMKLDTLVYAHMYDDTVRPAGTGTHVLSLSGMVAPKIEPEIVFRMRRALEPGTSDPAAALDAVEWLALGFEIIDCPYADWKFQPVDFVAARGLHTALVVGAPLAVGDETRASLAEALPRFTVALSCDGQLVEEGSGRNSLRSPALCLAELATALSRRSRPLEAGDLVSSGTLTESCRIEPGQTWTAIVSGLPLSSLTLETTA